MDQPQILNYQQTRHQHDAKRSGFVEPKIVPKPWGREEWLVVTDKYVMKKLFVDPGHELSLQYHEQKMETLTVVEGSCILTLGEEGNLAAATMQHRFSKGDTVHLNPRTIHTFAAIEPLVLFEVSTTELQDVVRLKDRYGRN